VFEIDVIRELAAIPVAMFGMYLIYRLATNHMNSLADAVDKLADVVVDLKDWLQREKNRN
jgi:fumarate reductase subunit C